MNRFVSLLRLDAQTLLRDSFLTVVAGITALLLILFGVAGLNRDVLGLSGIEPWVVYILTLFAITNTGTYGMLFGLVFVEEVETRVRAALMVTPIRLEHLVLGRSASVFLWLLVQPFVFVSFVGAAWSIEEIGPIQWFMVCCALAPLGAVFMIILSTIASNRVEALAMGKFFSAATAPPILLYLLPPDSWYQHLFLIFPTTPIIHALDAFKSEQDPVAAAWLLLGTFYALLLLTLAVRHHVRKSRYISA